MCRCIYQYDRCQSIFSNVISIIKATMKISEDNKHKWYTKCPPTRCLQNILLPPLVWPPSIFFSKTARFLSNLELFDFRQYTDYYLFVYLLVCVIVSLILSICLWCCVVVNDWLMVVDCHTKLSLKIRPPRELAESRVLMVEDPAIGRDPSWRYSRQLSSKST